MKLLYGIRDVKANDWSGGEGAFFVQGHDAVAIRTFSDVASDARSAVSRHPEDYELVRVAVVAFDRLLVQSVEGPVVPGVVMTGVQWLALQAKGPELAREA